MVEFSERNMAYGAIGAAGLGAAVVFMNASVIGPTLTLLLIAIAGVGIAFVYAAFMAGYIVMPMITGMLRVTEMMGEGYKVPPSQDVIVRNVRGLYQATIFLSGRFYEAAVTTAEEEATTAYMDLWERALATIRFPMKLSLVAYLEDIAKYRENIETQRYAATIKLGKEKEKPNPDALTIDKWEREIDRLNAMLARLTAGEKPMGALIYIATTGLGVSEDAAIAQAQKQANEIRSTVANALNIEIKPLKGEDMKKCFRWEYYIPPEPKEFLAQL